MADLLTDSDIIEITSAIRDVTDTFYQKPIILQKRNADAPLDRWQADRHLKKTVAYTETTLDGFMSQIGNQMQNTSPSSRGDKGAAGAIDYAEAKINFNFDYLDEQGFIDSELNILIIPETDYFKVEGIRYRILSVKKSGQLRAREKLVICEVRREEKSNRKDG